MTQILKNRIKNITTVLSKEQTVILETAFLTMVPILLTKITGQFFSLLAASYFGTANDGWNKFLLATSIPDMLTNVLLGGAIGSVIIPALITIKKKQGAQAFLKTYNSVITSAIFLFSIISLILALLGDIIFPLFLKTLIPGETTLTSADIGEIVSMMRVLLIPQILLGISVLISSGLNIYNRFLVPQLAPLFFNIGRILGLVILVPLLDYSPWAIVIGVLVGSVLHLAIQLPLWWSMGFRYRLNFHYTRDLRNMLFVSLPRTLALMSENIALTFNDFLAFQIGGLASLNYANSISLIVPSLFGATFAYASFTTLTELYEDLDFEKIKYIVTKTLNEMFFLALPFVITILILRIAIVRLAFGVLPNTRLDLDGTYQIAWVLLWFAVGHIFICGKWFMYRVFYAARQTAIPLAVSVVSLFLTIILGVFFTNLFSHNTEYSISSTNLSIENFFTRGTAAPAVGGIALGISIAYSIEFIILFIIFNKQVKINVKSLLKSIGVKFIAGAAMFVVMYLIYKTWNILTYALPVSANMAYRGSTTVNLFLLTVITVFTSFMVYYLVCLFFKVEELKILKKYLNPIFRIGGLRIRD